MRNCDLSSNLISYKTLYHGGWKIYYDAMALIFNLTTGVGQLKIKLPVIEYYFIVYIILSRVVDIIFQFSLELYSNILLNFKILLTIKFKW